MTDAGRRESARVILESSLKIARQLKLNVVAEGVETQQDWELLKDLGCDFAQGYYIARPMSGDAYCKWIRDVATHQMSVAKHRAE